MSKFITLCLLGLSLVVSARAATLFDDQFTDGSRTDQNWPTSEAWYSSGSYAPNLAVVNSKLVWNTSGGNSGILGTFTPQTLAAGESLTVSFTLSATGIGNLANSFRMGLFNSGGAPISADNWLTTNVTYSGFGVSADMGTLGSTTASYLWYRTTSTPGIIFSGSNLAAETGAAATGADLNLTAAQSYSGSFVVTNNGTSMSTTFTMNGVTLTMTDTSRTSYTTFDTLCFYGVNGVASSVSFSEISLASSAVPEPSAVVLLGLGLFGMILMRKSKLLART